MPEISRFLGIVIRGAGPDYADRPAQGDLAASRLGVGRRMGYDQAELLENWRRLHADEPPAKIAPLE